MVSTIKMCNQLFLFKIPSSFPTQLNIGFVLVKRSLNFVMVIFTNLTCQSVGYTFTVAITMKIYFIYFPSGQMSQLFLPQMKTPLSFL